MNEEEQKAIEDLRGYLEWNDKNSFSRLPRDNHIETVLNLISKLQKENKELSEKMVDKICKGIEEEVLEEYREKIKKLQKELDKKDKLINLMAQDRAEISEPKVSKEAIIDFYYKKVEEENE